MVAGMAVLRVSVSPEVAGTASVGSSEGWLGCSSGLSVPVTPRTPEHFAGSVARVVST
jgi:hypothetical protein